MVKSQSFEQLQVDCLPHTALPTFVFLLSQLAVFVYCYYQFKAVLLALAGVCPCHVLNSWTLWSSAFTTLPHASLSLMGLGASSSLKLPISLLL